MERDRKVELFNTSGIISTHLETDIVQMENRVLLTTQDLEQLEEILEELKARQDEIYEDEEHEGLAITAMEAYGRNINHLTLSIAHMKQKREMLNQALNCARAAAGELNLFGNAIPGIPTIPIASDSDSESLGSV